MPTPVSTSEPGCLKPSCILPRADFPFWPGGFYFQPRVLPGVFISLAAVRCEGRWRARIQPSPKHRRCLIESEFLETREKLHRSMGGKCPDFSFDPAQYRVRRLPREFIRFGKQHVYRLSSGAKPPQHALIELGQRVPHVHYESQAAERPAHLKIATQQFLPRRPHRIGNPGVAVAGKVHDESTRPERVVIDESSASRGLAHERQSIPRKRVDGA